MPEFAIVPDNPPPPTQLFAFWDDQLSITVLLERIEAISAEIVAVGAFQAVTDALLAAVPPLPVHDSE